MKDGGRGIVLVEGPRGGRLLHGYVVVARWPYTVRARCERCGMVLEPFAVFRRTLEEDEFIFFHRHPALTFYTTL